MHIANTSDPDIYLFQHQSNGEYEIQMMKYSDPKPGIDGTSIGDMFHAVFFRFDEDGKQVLDDEFEAIFAHPLTYIKRLTGTEFYGILARKTIESKEILNEIIDKMVTANDESISK